MPVERPNNNLVTGHINEIVCEYKLVFVVTQELGVLYFQTPTDFKTVPQVKPVRNTD